MVNKFLISDTTLIPFIPPQVSKMTLILLHICGCKICIIPKDIHIGLNRFRIIIVTCLKHNYSGIHTHNRLFSTTIYVPYKNKVFLYNECLHANIKYAAQCITCIPIKPNNMIYIKFASDFLMNLLSTIFLMKNYMLD